VLYFNADEKSFSLKSRTTSQVEGDILSDLFLTPTKKRSAIYTLGEDLNVQEDEIISTFKKTKKLAPWAFTSQISLNIILPERKYTRLVELTHEQLRKNGANLKLRGFFRQGRRLRHCVWRSMSFFVDLDVMKTYLCGAA
jgi:predicted oxidoreductase (fatty acid repression mutant protein)